jgi:signal transduction histidine kinase
MLNTINRIIKKFPVLSNYHFWIISFIVIVLILLYNALPLQLTRLFPFFQEIVYATGIYGFVVCFLYLIPILYASAIFKLRGLAVVWLIFLLSVLPRAIIELTGFEDILIVALFALVALLLGILVALDYNPGVKQKFDEALGYTTRMRHLARLVKIREYERQHIASKLHDSIIQSLLVIANRAHSIERGDSGEITAQTKKNLEKIQVMLLHVIDDVRTLSQGLRPGILDNVGLLPVLKWQAERLLQESGIRIDINIKGMEYKLPAETEVLIYRILQEIFKNIQQHSEATTAVLTLDFATVGFRISVKDNGSGFQIPQDLSVFVKKGKMGIDRIQQQVKLLDGTCEIISEEGVGTTVELVFPP